MLLYQLGKKQSEGGAYFAMNTWRLAIYLVHVTLGYILLSCPFDAYNNGTSSTL